MKKHLLIFLGCHKKAECGFFYGNGEKHLFQQNECFLK